LGLAASGVWVLVSLALGRRYEKLRQQQNVPPSQL
jgi:hypothetical protein